MDTDEQLARFVDKAMVLHASLPQKMGSFANCTTRFDGTRSEDELLAFINTVKLYKDLEKISDEVALQELHLTLYGEAATWWQEVKGDIHVWSEALKMLKLKFMPKKPAYEIYAALFAVKQDDYIPTEMFIQQKRALLAELPRPHPEDVQIDMIYSLLKSRIRRKVPRESVVSFDQLIGAAQKVEHSKYKRRVKRFQKFEYKALRPVSSALLKCSDCGKSTKFDVKGNCCTCFSRRHKTSRRRKEILNVTPPQNFDQIHLSGFNPDINPFSI